MIEVGLENFQKEVADDSGLVLVDFWATWCAPCKAQKPVLEALEGMVKIVGVDADDNPEICAAWGVQAIPTLVLFRNGLIVKSLTGFQPLPKLREWLQKEIDNAGSN